MSLFESMVDNFYWRLIELYQDREDHRYNIIVWGALSLIVGDHRTEDWLEEVIHCGVFDSEPFLHD